VRYNRFKSRIHCIHKHEEQAQYETFSDLESDYDDDLLSAKDNTRPE
jgi:hypothetical protein